MLMRFAAADHCLEYEDPCRVRLLIIVWAQVLERIKDPLMTLISRDQYETAYVVLAHFLVIVQRAPVIFSSVSAGSRTLPYCCRCCCAPCSAAALPSSGSAVDCCATRQSRFHLYTSDGKSSGCNTSSHILSESSCIVAADLHVVLLSHERSQLHQGPQAAAAVCGGG